MGREEDSLDYHSEDPPGKIAISTTKPTSTQRDLSLAYSPGVAAPCRAISGDPEAAYRTRPKRTSSESSRTVQPFSGWWTSARRPRNPLWKGKGFSSSVSPTSTSSISNSTQTTPTRWSKASRRWNRPSGDQSRGYQSARVFRDRRPTQRHVGHPVFHDDQHGTAIISGAALLNAAEVAGTSLSELNVVFSGAGASAVATAKFYASLGVERDRICMCDSGGIITENRVEDENLHEYKAAFARDIPGGDLAAAIEELIRSMASNPIVFCADATVNLNPDADVLEEVISHTADLARSFNVEPRAALLSDSNFGSADTEATQTIREAARRLRDDPAADFPVDGERQADTAVVEEMLQGTYDFASLDELAHILGELADGAAVPIAPHLGGPSGIDMAAKCIT